MCLLDACCYCIFLDIGCMIIATVILVFRVGTIVLMFQDPIYKDLKFTDDFSATHATIILAAVGCIVPIFLMWGVCTASPQCVCSFIILEIIYILVAVVWEMYFVVRHYSKNKPPIYYYYDYTDQLYNGYVGSSYIHPGSYDYYYDIRESRKKYMSDDYYWLGPVIFFLIEGYFLWVAYSYYRFLQDEYDEYGEPAIFYA